MAETSEDIRIASETDVSFKKNQPIRQISDEFRDGYNITEMINTWEDYPNLNDRLTVKSITIKHDQNCPDPSPTGVAPPLTDIQKADKTLVDTQEKSTADHQRLIDYHLPVRYNLDPKIDDDDILPLYHKDFINLYSKISKIPLFTAERLDGALLKSRSVQFRRKKIKHFRQDPRVVEKSSTKHWSGFDRGHMTPSGDMTDEMAAINTFQLTNIVPQYPEHNRKIWNGSEKYVREKAISKETIMYVITGATTSANSLRLSDGVVVPDALYKLLIWVEHRQIQAEFIFTRHENKHNPAIEWGSTERHILKGYQMTFSDGTTVTYDREEKTVTEIEDFIFNETGIRFEISTSRLCAGEAHAMSCMSCFVRCFISLFRRERSYAELDQ